MRFLFRSLVAAFLVTAAKAGAQTSITQSFSFTRGTHEPVGYLTFGVTAPGTFDIYTSMTGDPVIYLFAGTPGMLGTVLAADDDGGSGYNSFLSRYLEGGTYTVAVGRYRFYEDEARTGFMDTSDMAGTLSVTSTRGIATASMATVPEPSTYALLAAGLAGLAAAHRRRRTA